MQNWLKRNITARGIKLKGGTKKTIQEITENTKDSLKRILSKFLSDTRPPRGEHIRVKDWLNAPENSGLSDLKELFFHLVLLRLQEVGPGFRKSRVIEGMVKISDLDKNWNELGQSWVKSGSKLGQNIESSDDDYEPDSDEEEPLWKRRKQISSVNHLPLFQLSLDDNDFFLEEYDEDSEEDDDAPLSTRMKMKKANAPGTSKLNEDVSSDDDEPLSSRMERKR